MEKYVLVEVSGNTDDLTSIISLIHHEDFKYIMTLDSHAIPIYRYLFNKLGVDPKSQKLTAISSRSLKDGIIRVVIVDDGDNGATAYYAVCNDNIKMLIPEMDSINYSDQECVVYYLTQTKEMKSPTLTGSIRLRRSDSWNSDNLGVDATHYLSQIYGSKLKKYKDIKFTENED